MRLLGGFIRSLLSGERIEWPSNVQRTESSELVTDLALLTDPSRVKILIEQERCPGSH